MTFTGFSVSLPITDRQASHDFYSDGFGLPAVGEIASDGLPEPLQFDVGNGVLIILVPTGGFDWAIGERRMADDQAVSTVLELAVEDSTQVTAAFDRAVAAGGTPVASPAAQPWGMTSATVADPDGHLWLITSPA
ncbi:putative glyoxalase superfamily protein PhnB [Catenuloplanes nepalensis]|uniref:Glyoxalase superfamily protein PhnB n=1 Tax=Catenuloplanes nepalensis TaxID=587533 RepID=A0ABT9MTR1_9ACTN|nr:VOC family protein [Catenuloplanes nepalensis]MDP9794773.1 putative glyoxalase superfamily protein PhnB [Catenuloplanes nepalensis]